MGFFDRFRRVDKPIESIRDPVFGPLTSDQQGSWDGSLDVGPTVREVQIIIHVDQGTHTDGQRNAYVELSQRYRQLRPKIGDVLFELWKPWLDEIPERDRSAILPRVANQVLAHTQLDAIGIEPDGSLTLSYSFATDGISDDATLNVGLKEWVPRAVRIDD